MAEGRTQAGRAVAVRVGKQVDAATRRTVQAYAASWQRTRDELVRAAIDAERQAAERGALRSPAAYRTARLQRSLEEIGRQLRQLGAVPGVSVGRVIGPTVHVPHDVLQELTGRLPGVDFTQPPAEALRAIIRRTTERIASNRPALSAEAEAQLRQALVTAVAGGEGPRTAARRMVAATRAAKAAELGLTGGSLAELSSMGVAPALVGEVRGAFAGGMYRALNLQRTELIDASRHASTALWMANPGLVVGWRWVASLGPRTCPACWAMHNTVHRVEEHQLGHQSCRCTQVPVLADDLEGDDDVGDPLLALRRLPRATQLEVMGPRRLALLDEGLPITDLAGVRDNPYWRPGYYPRALRDLPDPGEPLVLERAPRTPIRPGAGEPEPVPFGTGLDPATMSDDALLDLMGSAELWTANEELGARVAAELDSRDELQRAAAARAAEPAVDDALDAWALEQAQADEAARAAGLDPAKVRRRTTAKQRDQRLREEYELWVESEMLRAAEATNGNLGSREAIDAGISDRSLFLGGHARAWRWASEELQRWWQDNPRLTYVEWKAGQGVGGERARKAARKAAEVRAKGSQRLRGEEGKRR